MGLELRRRQRHSVLRCGLGATVLTGAVLLSMVSGGAAVRPAVSPVSGAVYAWGDNDAGQLGVGTVSTAGNYSDAAVPEASHLPAGTVAVAVAAGQSHSLFATPSGAVYATGFNGDGQLGTGNTAAASTPVPVDLPAGVDITSVAAGYKQSLALSSTGAVYSWGANNEGQAGTGASGKNVDTPTLIPLPATASAIGVGTNHDLAVTSTGLVYDWGLNSTGQLGNGSTTNSDVPVQAQLPAGVVATAVAGAAGHSLALTSKGAVYAWGDNTHGQLGDGTETQSDVPVQVDLPAGVKVTAIAAGDGDISGLTGGYSLALTSKGVIYAWGDNASGNLGDNSTTDSDVPVLVQVLAGVTVTGISAGGNRCQLLTSAGQLDNWGTNENGSNVVLTPALDVLPIGETPVLINDGPDAEQYLVLMVPTSGTVYAWGDDDSGQLGVGSYVDSSKWEASEMPAGTESTAVTAGQSTSSAVTTTGAVYAWGYDFDGQLGNDSTVNTTTPVETDMPAGVVTTSVAIGWDQELALTSTGAVYAWGLNRYGELGIGSTEKFGDVPVQVTFPAGVVIASIATGAYQSLALSTAGQIYAWGQNTYGQLGTGTTTNSDVPLPVALPGGIPVALAGGDKDSFAVTQSGAVFAWGDNTYGQLGNGTFTASDTPALVSLPSGVKVQQVESGGQSPTAEPQSGLYALALTDTGQVYAWGSNAIGQLGDDSTTTSNVPVLSLVPSGVTIVQIGAGSNYAHALTNTGSIYYWGTQARGKDQQLDPVISPLPSGLNAVALSTGPDAEQSIALMQSTG